MMLALCLPVLYDTTDKELKEVRAMQGLVFDFNAAQLQNYSLTFQI